MRNNTHEVTDSEILWDKRKTAKFLGISPKTLDRWLYEKRGPRGIKVGVQVRFRPIDVLDFLNSCPVIGVEASE